MKQVEFTGYGPCPICGEEHDHTRIGISPDASAVQVQCNHCKTNWSIRG